MIYSEILGFFRQLLCPASPYLGVQECIFKECISKECRRQECRSVDNSFSGVTGVQELQECRSADDSAACISSLVACSSSLSDSSLFVLHSSLFTLITCSSSLVTIPPLRQIPRCARPHIQPVGRSRIPPSP